MSAWASPVISSSSACARLRSNWHSSRSATVRHCGSTERIGESAWYLYREWLPDSGEELRDFLLLFHYVKRMPEVPEHEQVTDVYLPLI